MTTNSVPPLSSRRSAIKANDVHFRAHYTTKLVDGTSAPWTRDRSPAPTDAIYTPNTGFSKEQQRCFDHNE